MGSNNIHLMSDEEIIDYLENGVLYGTEIRPILLRLMKAKVAQSPATTPTDG